MSDDLVQRLRADVFYGDARLANMDKHNPLHMEAADRIEALEAENERLREALKRIQHFSPAHMWRAPAIKEIASGALREKP